MTTRAPSSGRRYRQMLAVTTALAGFLAASPAWSQALPPPTLPGPDDVSSTTPSTTLGGKPGIDRNGNKLEVSLNARNTIINWDGFNIPENASANFDRGTLGPLGKIAVLNRDISANPSQLLGKLTSGENVAVWVLNPNGIIVGSKANFSTGSLVLSTLGVSDDDFTDGNDTYALQAPAMSQSAITVMKNAVINVEGGNRGLVMVAPKIDAYGTFDAHDQDVAFVTATDVKLTFTGGSPLSVQISQGTAVSGTSQFVRGKIEGADALFALATQGSVTDALLRVDASVTTALSGTRGIVLSAGRPSAAIDGVTVTGGAAEVGGIVGLSGAGDLVSTDNDGSDILAGASGGLSLTGELSSRRDVSLAGAGDVSIAGNVTAVRDYSVDGLTVTLGATNSTGGPVRVTQQADGKIDITANRALTGLSGLTLLANADGSTDNREVLRLAATFDGVDTAPDGTPLIVPSGTIDFARDTALLGGSDRQSSVRIRSGASDGTVSLGTVKAFDLLGAVGTADFTTGITRQAALTTDDVSLVRDVKLDGTTIDAGALTSSNEAVMLTSSAGRIGTRAIEAAKDVTIASAGTLATRTIDSRGAVSVSAIGDAIIRGDVMARDDLTIGAAAITVTGTTSGGTIDLLARSGAITTGNVNADDAVTINSAGILTAGTVTSGGAILADAVGDATFSGDLGAADDLVLRAGSIALGGRSIKAGGLIDLQARVGGISGVDGLKVESTSTRSVDFVRLQAAGVQGIDLGGSTIIAGANRALPVAVRNETDGATLILGDVTARALVALSATNGDPRTMAVPIVSSGSLTFGKLDLVNGFSASSTGGDLAVSRIDVSGDREGIYLAAPSGTLSVQSSVSADGNVTLIGGAPLRLDSVESASGSASVTSAGAVNLMRLSGPRGATASGTSVAIGTVDGGMVNGGLVGITATAGGITLGGVTGGAVTLGATGGDIAVNDVVSSTGDVSATGTGAITFEKSVTARGGGIVVRAGTGRASLLGDVDAAGNYRVSGQSVALAGDQKATGTVAITTTDGAIVGRSGLVLASDSDGAGGESLRLDAAGGIITLASDSLLSGGRDARSAVTVTTDGNEVTLGDVTARSLSIALSSRLNATIATGDLMLSDALSAAASNGIKTGIVKVDNGGVTLDGGFGLVDTGMITAGKAVSLTGGSVTAGAISGTNVDISASTGSAKSGDITAEGSVNVTAPRGLITVGRVDASGPTGDVTMTSGGRLYATKVTADGAASLSTTDTGAAVLLLEGLSANDAVTVSAGGNIFAPFIRSLNGTLTVSAPNGNVTGFNGTDIDLSAGLGKAFSLTVGGTLQLGDIGGGPTSITASAITVRSIHADDFAVSLDATNGDLTVSGPVVAGDTSLTATGMTNLQSVAASGTLTLSGGTGLGFTDVSGTIVTASSGGAINGTSARATKALSATGASLSLGQADADGALTLSATGGDAVLNNLSAGKDATISATGRAAVNGDVEAGGGYSVTGASVTLGDHAVTQRAAGPIAITAMTDDIDGADGLTLVNTNADGAATPAITLDSAGAIALAGSTLQTGGALGLRAGAGETVMLGRVEAASVGGFDGKTAGGTFAHAGSTTIGDIFTGAIDIALSSGDLKTGAVNASGAVTLAAAAGAIATDAIEGASIDLTADGALSATSLVAANAATLAGSDIRVDTVRAGSVDIQTAGALTGHTGERASLASTIGNVTVASGDAMLGAIDSAGALSLDGGAIDASGKLAASRDLLVKARAALTAAEATAGGTLSLTSGADLSLGTGQAGGAATIDAGGLASLGAFSAGPSIAIRANDAALTGTVRAISVTFQNGAAATSVLRLGDGTATGGFRLSNAEVALVNADAVRFDQGAGDMQIGALAFGADTGRRTVDLLTTGAIAVDGTVTGGGLGRVFRIGGSATDGAASDIRVTATSAAGGRLLFNDADLDLRGDRIAVGLAPGFLDGLTPGEAGRAQALAYINDGNSALYNAGLGGGFYDPAATTIVSAHTLNVRFADFALFQNTGVPGRFSGAVLGGTPAMPVMPALSVTTTGTPGNTAFAIFGTINGVGDASAALLGPGAINIDPGLLPTSRINGCLAGSGTGCLTTIVIQPVLQIFDWSSEDVFGVAQDVSTPFDPAVGGNNEELLTGLPALAPAGQLPDGRAPAEGVQQ